MDTVTKRDGRRMTDVERIAAGMKPRFKPDAPRPNPGGPRVMQPAEIVKLYETPPEVRLRGQLRAILDKWNAIFGADQKFNTTARP